MLIYGHYTAEDQALNQIPLWRIMQDDSHLCMLPGYFVPGTSLGKRGSESGGLDKGATHHATSQVDITLYVMQKPLPLAQDMGLLQTYRGAQGEKAVSYTKYTH